MTFDASNRKAIRLAEKALVERERAKIDYLCAAMSTPQGRLWFHDLLADCGIGNETPIFEPIKDYYTSGRRSVGLQIRALLETHCPDQYIQMMKDEHVRLAAAAERSRRAGAGWNDFGSELDPTSDNPAADELWNGPET